MKHYLEFKYYYVTNIPVIISFLFQNNKKGVGKL